MGEHANGKVYCVRNQFSLLHSTCPCTALIKYSLDFHSLPCLQPAFIRLLPFLLISQHTGIQFFDFFLLLSKKDCKTLCPEYLFWPFLFLNESYCSISKSKQVKRNFITFLKSKINVSIWQALKEAVNHNKNQNNYILLLW